MKGEVFFEFEELYFTFDCDSIPDHFMIPTEDKERVTGKGGIEYIKPAGKKECTDFCHGAESREASIDFYFRISIDLKRRDSHFEPYNSALYRLCSLCMPELIGKERVKELITQTRIQMS